MKFPRLSLWLAALLPLVLVGPATAQDDGWRTIEFETTEVTSADVAVSPDGEWLIFTILGHLFRLPVEGGDAEQLTFGPYYDTDPVFSPDGNRVAFVSDRDGSAGNVFVLEVANGKIRQLTHDSWAARPTWSPDGQAIAYLSLLRETPGVTPTPRHSVPETVPALVRRVGLLGEEPERLSDRPQLIGSVFYLPGGLLAWTAINLAIELEGSWRGRARATTKIQVMSTQGTVSTLRTLAGYAAPGVPSADGDGLYIRRFRPVIPWHRRPAGDLLFLPLPEGSARLIAPLSRPRGWTPRFAVSGQNESLYLGAAGRLWEIALPSGARRPIPFAAQVTLEVRDPVLPRPQRIATGTSAAPRVVMHPRLSPDGSSLVFSAARYLWKQPLDGGQAQRLFEGSAIEGEPTFSPDGRRLAFTHREYKKQELRVFDFAGRKIRTLASGPPGRWQPSWSSDGQRLAFVRSKVGPASEAPAASAGVVAVNLGDGKEQKLADPGGQWIWPRPHFADDGRALYYSADITFVGALYRLPFDEGAQPQPITQLEGSLSDGLISPNGKWLAFQRGQEVWGGPLSTEPIREEDVRQLSREGGEDFAFTPNSSALIYSTGNRIWRHPLTGGEREEIPIRLELPRPTPPPLLVRRVRVLDFPSGGFDQETSLFIEEGRIRWIGEEGGLPLPKETRILDAGGRFAIPGLFDMHVHRVWARPEASLAYGVTSVRDMGGSLTQLSALADRSEATNDPLPHYFYPGWAFAPWLIHNEGDARANVRRWNEQGAHFIKPYPPLSWPLQRAVAEEARKLELPVVGHGTDVEEITKSVTLGYLTLEHTPSPPPYDDVLQMFAAAGTRWVPTLAQYGGDALLLRDEPERLANPKLRAFTPEPDIHVARVGGSWNSVGDTELRGLWEEKLAAIRAAHLRGVKLQVGTDAGAPGILFGPSLHWELEYFVEAGLAPLEVLRIATQEGAAAVGADDDLGTLEVGKLADIVLLDADPLEDIKNTQTIWRVLKGGWVFDPEELRPPSGN